MHSDYKDYYKDYYTDYLYLFNYVVFFYHWLETSGENVKKIYKASINVL